MACCAQVVEEDRGVESAGIDEDGFHEFSGCRFSCPGNSLAGTGVEKAESDGLRVDGK